MPDEIVSYTICMYYMYMIHMKCIQKQAVRFMTTVILLSRAVGLTVTVASSIISKEHMFYRSKLIFKWISVEGAELKYPLKSSSSEALLFLLCVKYVNQ